MLSESLLVEVGYLHKEQGVILRRRAPCLPSDTGSYHRMVGVGRGLWRSSSATHLLRQVHQSRSSRSSELIAVVEYEQLLHIYFMVFSTDVQLSAVRLKSVVDTEA